MELGMKVQTTRDGWELWTWERELPAEGVPLAPKRRAALREQLAGLEDSQKVELPAGELRILLAAADRPRERGARIEGKGANAGVTYFATVDAEGGQRLRTVEVVTDAGPADPRVFRVPVRVIEDLTRYVVAAQERAADVDDTDPSDVIVWDRDVPEDGNPSPEDLYELLKANVRRADIATIYNRSERRIYQLLEKAKLERKDLDWPKQTRGPRPKTTDGSQSSAS